MTKDTATVNIPNDVLEPIISAKIHTAIIEALGDEKGVIERIVSDLLTRQIKPDQYSSKSVPWIEHTCLKVLRAAAEQAIQEWAASKQDELAAEFVRQLQQKTNAKRVVRAMIDGMAEVAGSRWNFSVEIKD